MIHRIDDTPPEIDDIPGAQPAPGRCQECDGEGRIAAYGCGDQAGGYADTCQECKGSGQVDPDDQPEPWPDRSLAFSILLQPCGSCGDAIPVLGPRVCAACYEGGYCPICSLRHGPRLCPEVAAVIAEQETQERAYHSTLVQFVAEDWQRDAEARAWSRSLLGAA